MGEACLNSTIAAVSLPRPMSIGAAWYAIQTAYRCERGVEGDLKAKGFSTYLPLLREVHQWKDREKVVDVPAFSGYLFVNYEPTLANRVKVLETRGTLRLLGGNHAPSPISSREIEAIQRALDNNLRCEKIDPLTPGSMVRVTRGPLAGFQGRLVRIKNSLRLILIVTAFSQAISAELNLEDVEAVNDQPATVCCSLSSERRHTFREVPQHLHVSIL